MQITSQTDICKKWLLKKKNQILWILLAFSLAVVLWFSYYNFRVDFKSQTDILTSHLYQQGQELTFDISRYEFIPLSLSFDNNITESLRNSGENSTFGDINSRLKMLQTRIGAQAIFVVNSQGNIVFSSDAEASDSLVGHNVKYRPYFQRVKAGLTEHYFGVGTTHDVPGYYQSNGYFSGNEKLGAVVVKVDINDLLKNIQPGQENILLDQAGVIVSTRHAAWLYHSLTKLPAHTLSEVNKEHKYLSTAISPLAFKKIRTINANAEEIMIDDTRYIMVRQYLPKIHMTLSTLSPVSILYKNIAVRIALGTAILIFVVVSIFILAQRNQIIHLRLENQQMLITAYNRLEELVRQRTQELETQRYELEVALRQRIASEEALLNMQKELVRSEKLAAIGRLSAGLAHEINQPLSAIGIMAANAVRFMAIAEHNEVKANLERISRLVDFIGRISNQLRSFSRNSDDVIQSVLVAGSIDNAMLLLGHRFKEHESRFVRHPPSYNLYCFCNSVRLEQVLVNIISNALEAVKERHNERRVSVQWYQQENDVVIDIEDNGPGIPVSIIEHIFEPFFTTKKNHGLGLGLAISADIIRSYGGTISVESRESGAKFTLRLPVVPSIKPENKND
ncbi:ATP-binding protein [Phytobacter sp. RSE-02]|uniref:ATP-binding protein n=1 Tax=Phytobacter sp. RSE-02 TaxID=3229229 RepID=UPI00339D5472